MTNPNPITPTPEQSALGVRNSKLSRRAVLRLAKKRLKVEEQGQLIRLAEAAFTSPVMSGVIAYLLVDGIETTVKQVKKLSTPAPTTTTTPTTTSTTKTTTTKSPNLIQLPGVEGFLANVGLNTALTAENIGSTLSQDIQSIPSVLYNKLTSSLGGGMLGGVGNLFSNLDFDALKLAILIYIATGGNLAGLLTSISSLVGSLGGGAGGAAAEGAAVAAAGA